MAILLTGASGFIGQALIPKLLEKGHKVYGLSRHPPAEAKNLIPLVGDVTKPNLGLEDVPNDIDSVVHCAALLSFSPRDKNQIFLTNCQGTSNLIQLMTKNKIPRLFHISTAFLFDNNDYEISKKEAEQIAKSSPQITTTVIRPSIIIGDSKVEGLPPLSGFYIGIRAIDRAKRWFEKRTGTWPLRANIRIKANESGSLNLIPVDKVADLIVEVIEENKEGIFYATHPNPPTFKALEKPVSEAIGANIKVTSSFKPNIVERLAATLMKGLSPYLGGNQLPSDIDCQPLTQEFLTRTIRAFLDR